MKPHHAIGLLILAAFAIRLYFILDHQGMWGVDGGAYLLSRNEVLGLPRLVDFPRPPLAPGWLLVPFTAVLGDDGGLKAFSLVASFAILPGFLLFARLFLKGWPLVVAAGFVLFDWMLAEMFTAGVLPMIGFGLLFVAMWGVWILKTGTGRWGSDFLAVGAVAFSIPAIAYTNQTATALAAIVLTAVALGLGLDRFFVRRLILPVVLGLGLAATALPWYLGVLPGSDLLRYPGPLVGFYSFANAGWFQLVIGLGVGIWAVVRSPTIRPLGVVLLALTAMTPLLSFDETVQNIFYRARYLQGSVLYICLIWLVLRDCPAFLRGKVIVVPALVIMGLLIVPGYLVQLHAETKLGRMVSPDTLEAIGWLKQQSGQGGIGTNSYSLSLYVSALTQRPSPWTQIYDPPPLYRGQHGLMSCLLGWEEDCDPAAAAEVLGVDWLLIEEIWPSYGTEDIANNVPGLGQPYRVLKRFSPWASENIGYIWAAPSSRESDIKSNPWEVTRSRATWLTPVWRKGTTQVWRVK